MLTLFQRLANRRAIIVLSVLYTLFPAAILPWAETQIKSFSGGVGPIDLRFTYTASEVFAMVAAYGEAGRSFYRIIEFTADVAYPLLYALFFGALLTGALRRAFPAHTWMQQIPLLAGVMLLVDFAENIGIVIMLTQFPVQNETVATITSILTTTKWILFGNIVGALLISVLVIVGAKLFANSKVPRTTQ